jgi:hypothetical protein
MASKRLLPRLFEVNEERCNLSATSIDLNFNEACLFVSSTASKVLNFLGQSSECYQVKHITEAHTKKNKSKNFTFSV